MLDKDTYNKKKAIKKLLIDSLVNDECLIDYGRIMQLYYLLSIA